jgi:hypothetical protein
MPAAPRTIHFRAPAALAAAILLAPAVAAAEREVFFAAPDGVREICVPGVRIPGGAYSASDEQQERRFCSADFRSPHVALCPKMWSTSPATIVYDISGGKFPGDPAQFESKSCPRGGPARRDASAELAIYKMSVNAPDTSGTFSPASLLYYHLSRYFDTELNVPVSVLRTVGKGTLLRRVIEPGVRYTANKPQLRMLHAGFRHMEDAAANPSAPGAGEMLTPDGRQFFGIMILESGNRYGPEMNGTRNASWGAGQNRMFQKTAPFLALRQAAPLPEAIREGVRLARLDPAMSRSLGASASAPQMAFWMRELTELVLLDFILGQQDRIGNIDFVEHWYWVRDGRTEHRPAAGGTPPADISPLNPVRIKRTWLNDNDAGARASYSDFAQQTHMLDSVAHFGAATYGRLLRLRDDLESSGEIYQHLSAGYHLDQTELGLIVKCTRAAADVLQKACREKRLRFDLEPGAFLLHGAVEEASVDCDHP